MYIGVMMTTTHFLHVIYLWDFNKAFKLFQLVLYPCCHIWELTESRHLYCLHLHSHRRSVYGLHERADQVKGGGSSLETFKLSYPYSISHLSEHFRRVFDLDFRFAPNFKPLSWLVSCSFHNHEHRHIYVQEVYIIHYYRLINLISLPQHSQFLSHKVNCFFWSEHLPLCSDSYNTTVGGRSRSMERHFIIIQYKRCSSNCHLYTVCLHAPRASLSFLYCHFTHVKLDWWWCNDWCSNWGMKMTGGQ